MRIVVKPLTDKYIDQLWGAISKFLELSKEKHPELPKMEIILEGDNAVEDPCVHEFKLTDVSEDIIMIQCQICQRVYHVQYSEVEAGMVGP